MCLFLFVFPHFRCFPHPYLSLCVFVFVFVWLRRPTWCGGCCIVRRTRPANRSAVSCGLSARWPRWRDSSATGTHLPPLFVPSLLFSSTTGSSPHTLIVLTPYTAFFSPFHPHSLPSTISFFIRFVCFPWSIFSFSASATSRATRTSWKTTCYSSCLSSAYVHFSF